jgi:polyhydroxyalkanoate synthase subunit PhaC
MPAHALATPPLVEPLRRIQFAILDLVRRAQGRALGAAGFDPSELPYRVVAAGDHWRLRDYAGSDASASLLIVAAPIKRPYIWDLAPTVSAIRYCLDRRLHVYLMEWTAPTHTKGSVGLDECVKAIAECVVKIASQSNGTKPFLIGHSLGGTLAAVFGAYDPQAIRGLLLLGAPLCFQPATSRFRDALVSIVPPDLTDNGLVPGSLLSHASALASPNTFLWSRLLDAAMSMGDLRALEIHLRVERWALDEAPLPGKLVQQIVGGCIAKTDSAVGPSPCGIAPLFHRVSISPRLRWSTHPTRLRGCAVRLDRTAPWGYADEKRCHYQIRRRDRSRVAAPWHSCRPRGLRPRLAGHPGLARSAQRGANPGLTGLPGPGVDRGDRSDAR